MVSSRRSSPVAAATTRTWRSWTSRMTGVRAWVRPMPMWWSLPLTRRVTAPVSSILSWRRRSWVSAVRSVDGAAYGRAAEMGAAVVVLVLEPVEQGLQVPDRGGLVGLGAQPGLHGLLEAFDLAAGGGVVRAGVLLGDAQAA